MTIRRRREFCPFTVLVVLGMLGWGWALGEHFVMPRSGQGSARITKDLEQIAQDWARAADDLVQATRVPQLPAFFTPEPAPPAPARSEPRRWTPSGMPPSLAAVTAIPVAPPPLPPLVHEVECVAPPVVEPPSELALATGRALFLREWRSTERSTDPHQADGLGPLFNGRSCVECHLQGGVGGAGPASKNILFRHQSHFTEMIHRFGSSPRHANWRAVMLNQRPDPRLPMGKPAADRQMQDPVQFSERNATALFGAGLIDSIPEAVLLEVEQDSKRRFPAEKPGDYIGGRLNRLHGKHLGRFGWKGQVASLQHFVAGACAMELGLNSNFQVQPHPEYQAAVATDLDLTDDEFDGLVAWIGSLPAPRQQWPERLAGREQIQRGQLRFTQIGCAECHLPNLGHVEGIYSDLLLHDMGPDLVGCHPESGYGGHRRGRRECGCRAGEPDESADCEWRTPPLWGCRDSGPYLHDGRAPTLEKAIKLHGGQGRPSAIKFRELGEEQKAELLAFLQSLAAPR